MRSFLTYGLISLVGVASLYACSDDSGDGGSGGNGGTGNGGTAGAGQGGTAGNSSMAGNGGGGASSVGGSGGAAGPDVTAQATCTGCVELITPVSGANSATNLADQAIFQIAFPTPGVDFTNGVITWKIMPLQNNDNLFVNTFAQNGPPDGYTGVYPTYRALSVANFPAGQWTDVVLDISAYRGSPSDAGTDAAPPPVVVADAGDAGAAGPLDPNGFIKERVQFIGIQVGTAAAYAGPATTVRVAVDSVTIAGVPGQTGFTFDTTNEGLASNSYELPPGTPAPVHH
jgi:hypothetical protein